MFKKAVKQQLKLTLLVTAPSGGGKTYSALLIAKGMGAKRIAVIDSENGKSSVYADRFEFDVCEIEPPYSTAKYISAMKEAEKAGYDVLIVDSLSHQWAGEGGLLQEKEKLDLKPGSNSYTNWAKMTPEHEKFKNAILHCGTHLICTVRSKQDYVVEQNDRGKSVPRKVGLAPVQREGMEYEFDVVFDLDVAHFATVSKDRTSLFDGKLFKPSEETGAELIKWLASGVAAPAKPGPGTAPTTGAARFAKPAVPKPVIDEMNRIVELKARLGLTDDELKKALFEDYGQDTLKGLSLEQLRAFADMLANEVAILDQAAANPTSPEFEREAAELGTTLPLGSAS